MGRLKNLGGGDAARLIFLNFGYIIYSAVDRLNDHWYGIKSTTPFRGIEPLDCLSLVGDCSDANPYVPTPYDMFRKMLRSLDVPVSSYGFVDFGSGRGRTLVVAARFGFKEVIGVEFARELHDAACANIAVSRAQPARSVLCDARKFAIPEIPCVLFFFNPFTGNVLQSVIENLLSSFRNNPRHIVVALFNATSAPFLNTGVFRLRQVVREGRISRLSHSGRYSVSILETCDWR